MSFVRIHTCLPATDEGRMNEYVWSDVAFTQTIVVYVPVVGSLPATFVAYANTKLSPSVLAVEDQTCCPKVGAPDAASTNAYMTTLPPPVAPKATTFQSRLS